MGEESKIYPLAKTIHGVSGVVDPWYGWEEWNKKPPKALESLSP